MSLDRLVSIVDDEQDITALFRDALTNIKGITVFTFTDPLMALEHFQMNRDDYVLVISDLRMPGLDGKDFLRKIKETNNFVKTILMTAFDIDDEIFRQYTKKKIIDAFIQKPIRMQDLIKEVDLQIHSYEMQKTLPSHPSH